MKKRPPFCWYALLGLLSCSLFASTQLSAQQVKILRVNGKAGIGQILPGRWGMLAVDIANDGDTDAHARYSVQFHVPEESNTGSTTRNVDQHRYVREIWLPPHSMRRSWIPVKMPGNLDRTKTPYLEVRTYLYLKGSSAVSRSTDELFHTFRVPIEKDKNLSVLVTEFGRGKQDEEFYDLVLKTRTSAEQTPRLARFTDAELPPLEEGLDSANQIILASDRIRDDEAGRRALRQWVMNGGRLWIMMGRVKPETVRLLLGDAFPCHVADETHLPEILIRDADPKAENADIEKTPRQYDHPVRFVRVLPEGLEVSHRIGEWPAALWTKMGRGEVLITTLDLLGFLRSSSRFSNLVKKNHDQKKIIVARALRKIARRFYQAREPVLVTSETIRPYLSAQIGYEIASRSQVGAILLGFCLVLACGGIVLAFFGKLGRIGLLAPLAAIVSSFVVLFVGSQSRSGLEPTVAMLQVIHAQAGGEQLEVTGLLAIYENDKSQLDSRAQGGTFDLNIEGLGTNGQFVWTSINQWSWEDLNLPQGVRFGPFRGQVVPSKPVSVSVTFDEQGLIGDLLPGPLEPDNDLVLLYSHKSPRMGVKLSEGKVTSTVNDVLPEDRYIQASPATQEQLRREAVLKLALQKHKTFPQRPTLAMWCKTANLGFTFPNIENARGAALVLIPVEFRPPRAGSKVTIPSAFITYGTSEGPNKRPRTTAFNQTTGKWVAINDSAEAWLRVELPPAVNTLQVNKVSIALKIQAPNRAVSILGAKGTEISELKKFSGPTGVIRVDLDQSEYLQVTNGALLLALKVDAPANATNLQARMNADPAQIDYVQFTVEGQVPGEVAGR